MSRSAKSAAAMRRAAVRTLRVLAILYPLALLLVLASFRWVGERWAVTAVLLYLPRIGFAIPLPLLTLGVWIHGPRRLLVTQLVALGLIVFPLMGLHVSRPRAHRTPSIRVFSCNIHLGTFGKERVVARIKELNPDVVLLQEAEGDSLEYFRARLPGYSVQASTQFLLGTRFPVRSQYEPPQIRASGVLRSPRFIGYTLETPLGIIDLLHVHPISPREGFHAVRGMGLRQEIKSGRIFKTAWAGAVMANAELRRLQIAAVVRQAEQSRGPVIVAGDTNLPEQSFILGHHLGGYADGFAEVGNGFGYTFPADKRPWMRIDRILASRNLEFVDFFTQEERASDHLCIAADLTRSAPARP
jgi:endonuclease/exonuclease/phosphatase (EEP) superfamily protein YafD